MLRAFAKLKQEQRDYYDMKYGFASRGDGAEVHEAQRSLFDDISEDDLSALRGGFGEKIWTLFKDSADVITKTTLRAACPDDPDEIERILDKIESLL